MSSNTNRLLKVFLCHASDDKPTVHKLYSRLLNDGIDAWLDTEKLLPGQNWKVEIPKAVKNSDVVIVCLSNQSINKEGFIQKEIKIALDTADEKPESAIFIIPARLENCNVPERITQYQWVDLFSDDGYKRLMKALQLRANTLGFAFQSTIKNSIKGVYYNKQNSSTISVLQFYDDGKVVSVTLASTDIHQSWSAVSKWFRHNYDDSGTYRLSGMDIEFSTTSSEGTVDYTGNYLGRKLLLNIHSHINGRQKKDVVYEYLQGINSEDE